MAAPINASWADNDISDSNLNQTTYGQGTSFPATWPTTRIFWRTDTNVLYKNTGSEGTPTWSALTGNNLKTYLTLSTTIGDYSSPANAVATSEALGTASFIEVFTTNSGFTQTGTLVTVDSGTADKLSFDNANNGTDRRVHKSLGLTLSNTAWVARFEYRFSASTAPAHLIFHVSSGAGDPYNATLDAIGISHTSDVANELQLFASDGASKTYAGASQYVSISVNTTYYVELARTSATSARLKVFSDSGYTSQVGTTQTLTIASGTQTLTTFGASCNAVGSSSRYLTATVDNLSIYDASVYYSAGLSYDTSTSTYWKSNSEANPAIYVDLTSDREIVGIALNINTTDTTVSAFKVRASTDTTFTDAENIAYVNESNFTNNTWRYLPINFLTSNRRYIQFYGVDTGVFSIYEIKVRYGVSDTAKILGMRVGTRTVDSADSFVDSN